MLSAGGTRGKAHMTAAETERTAGRRCQMNKIKIYLDTSVISYLDQQDSPERMKETQEIWEFFKKGSMRYTFPMWWCMRSINAAWRKGKLPPGHCPG